MTTEQQITERNRHVEQLRQAGQYQTALPFATQTYDLARLHLGERHPLSAVALNNLALLYEYMGNYNAAEHNFRQALQITRDALGGSNYQVAGIQNNLAGLYHDMGRYVEAAPLYRRALEILRTTEGENHPHYAAALNNLALVYKYMGDYETAERTFQRALEIERKSLGAHHLEVAGSLNNLGELYREMGNYSKAKAFHEQARDINEKALPKSDHRHAIALNNLALLYHDMGDFAQAGSLYEQALQILRNALGENNLYVATNLSNLAVVYRQVHNFEEADSLYKQALEILSKTVGKNSFGYANGLHNLATLYDAMGNYAEAETRYSQVLDIRSRVLGKSHPDYARSLSNLAFMHQKMGRGEVARPLYEQALEIMRRTLGEDHPLVALTSHNLAALHVRAGREAEAMRLMNEASGTYDRMIGQVFSMSSERQQMVYLQTLRAHLEAFLSLVLERLSHSSVAVQAALNLVLKRKAIGAEALAVQRTAVFGRRYPGSEAKLRELVALRAQIARKTLDGPGREGLEVHRQLLAYWHSEKEKLEEQLAHRIPEMNLERHLRTADRQAVARTLPAGSALVEFVRFNVFDFKAVPARGEPQWKPARYLAFVVRAQEPDSVRLIDLGEAEPIERSIASFRGFVTGEGYRHSGPDSLVPEGDEDGMRGLGLALREALFDPLIPALGSRRRLFVAPDGDLSHLPLEVLPTDDGGRLIDDYSISYLGVGRDVLRFEVAFAGRSTDPLVAADPDFDLGAVATREQQVQTPGRQSRDLDRRGLHFGRLPGTRVEGERIGQLLGVRPLLEGAVLEGRLKTRRSPSILHIATHGFFLPDQKRDPDAEQVRFGAVVGPEDGRVARLTQMENPLLRSGLALAGANTWVEGHALPEDAEDAILNAEDVTGMDLLGTELVVLSACETGLGEVHVGEGVYGLRRAFVLAGAKTLVMSLWKVPDEETRELMEDFYQRVLQGRPRAEALREAQLAMRAKHPDPFCWGAFICQGDVDPLPQHVANSSVEEGS